MNVFLLWHVNELSDGEENSKLIGVYSTRLLADESQKLAAQLPGFRNRPQGFIINSYEINRDEWREGFSK
jgi:hypothetical protein